MGTFQEVPAHYSRNFCADLLAVLFQYNKVCRSPFGPGDVRLQGWLS
jgi:hypothetical protein